MNRCSYGIAAVCRRNHSSSMQRRLESDAENRYLNGRAYGSNFIRHSELWEGARLEFTMSDQAIY